MKRLLPIIIMAVWLLLAGCSIPKDTQWYKPNTTTATVHKDTVYCEQMTAMFWPFCTYTVCMQRKGYRLISIEVK